MMKVQKLQPYIEKLLLLLSYFMATVNSLPAQELPWIRSYIVDKATTRQEIRILSRSAAGLWRKNKDSAIHLLQLAFEKSKAIGHTFGMAHTLMSKGGIQLNTGQASVARDNYQKAYKYCLIADSGKLELMIKWHCGVGGSFSNQGLHDSAIVYLLRGLSIAATLSGREQKKAMRGDIFYLTGLTGFSYYWKHDYSTARVYLKRAEQLALTNKSSSQLAEIYPYLINFYTRQHYFDSAYSYIVKMEVLFSHQPVKLNIINSTYGYFYMAMNKPGIALKYFRKIIDEYDGRAKIAKWEGIGLACLNLKDYKQAKVSLLKALHEASRIAHTAQSEQLYRYLSQVYDSIGEYQNAYEYLYKYKALSDSTAFQEKANNINELEIRYQSTLKNKELTAQRLQLEISRHQLSKRNNWTAAAIATLLLIIVFLVVRYRLKMQQQKISQLKAQIAGEEKERARIGHQLHDDVMVEFSIAKMNIETLPDYFPELRNASGYKSIVTQLTQATTKLRQTAHNLIPDALLEDGLPLALSYFCKSMERSSLLKIDFQHYGDMPRIAIETEITLYRMVQELMQNIIKHAQATAVWIQLNYRPGFLNITIEDNGIGFHINGTHNDGIGLKSIRARLKTIGGSLSIETLPQKGTEVNIDLDIT